MIPPTSSLAPSSALTSSGPSLRPRTPIQPRPDFVIQSPDLRVAPFWPSPNRSPADSDHDISVYEVSSGDSDTTDGIGNEELEVSNISDNDNLTVPPKNKKKARKSKPKVHVVKSRGRPRGSGASVGLTHRPSKKNRKGRVEVSLILTFIIPVTDHTLLINVGNCSWSHRCQPGLWNRDRSDSGCATCPVATCCQVIGVLLSPNSC